jgi:hypothetical protein
MRAVSDEMVLTLSAAGTADDVAARISALLKAGSNRRCCFLSRRTATPVEPSSGRSRPYHNGSTRPSCLICAHGIAQKNLQDAEEAERRDKMNGAESLVRTL